MVKERSGGTKYTSKEIKFFKDVKWLLSIIEHRAYYRFSVLSLEEKKKVSAKSLLMKTLDQIVNEDKEL